MKISKIEFERNYASSSGMTMKEFRSLGLFAIPCDCEYINCKGWQMSSKVYSKIKEDIEKEKLNGTTN